VTKTGAILESILEAFRMRHLLSFLPEKLRVEFDVELIDEVELRKAIELLDNQTRKPNPDVKAPELVVVNEGWGC